MIPEMKGDIFQCLRGFFYVAKSGSVRRAAELMHRNPSTISCQLKTLEDEFETKFFTRQKRNLVINEQGKKLLGWTQALFETLQNMRNDVSSDEGHLQGEISLAATLPAAVTCAPVITRFLREFPDVHVHMERHLNVDVANGVKDSRYDFGITGLTSTTDLDNFEICLKSRPMLVTRRDNAWGIPAIPTESDLRRLPWVVFQPDRDTAAYGLMHNTVRSFQENVTLEVNNYHLVLQFVRTGLGVGVMDELCFRTTRYGSDWSSLVCYPLDHLLPLVLYGILTRRRRFLTPQALVLMEVLKDHLIQLGRTSLLDSEDLPGNIPEISLRGVRRAKAGQPALEADDVTIPDFGDFDDDFDDATGSPAPRGRAAGRSRGRTAEGRTAKGRNTGTRADGSVKSAKSPGAARKGRASGKSGKKDAGGAD